MEHESSLDIVGFAQLVDLYAHYTDALRREHVRTCIPFDAFVRDAATLATAADVTQLASGIATRAPLPLP